ncbi:hypothetical protein MBLNU13_g10964t1 [Cladosporium sp. NU13]
MLTLDKPHAYHNLSTTIPPSRSNKREQTKTKTMPSTQPAATTHPQGRRGAISVPEGQDLGDYMQQQQQQQQIQAQTQARSHVPPAQEANTQPEQQAVAGAETPEEHRS